MSFVFFDSACEPADRDSRVIDLKNLSVIMNNNDFSQTGSVIMNNTGDGFSPGQIHLWTF